MNQQSKFDLWWNSYTIKRIISAAYSLGAAIVILGALFKILHLNYANEMLMVGMLTEVLIFSLGVFDKPHKEFNWNNVFDFSDGNQKINLLSGNGQTTTSQPASYKTSAMLESEIEKLSEGIKSLTATAKQLNDLSSIVEVTDKFVKNIENASASTKKYTQTQDSLNAEVERLHISYSGISTGMDAVEKNTKHYSSKIEDINRNLASINSIYEIQLKNIHLQSESITSQSDSMRKLTDELNAVISEVKKIKISTTNAVEEAENFKNNAVGLSRNIADLNRIYGNMLNALS